MLGVRRNKYSITENHEAVRALCHLLRDTFELRKTRNDTQGVKCNRKHVY